MTLRPRMSEKTYALSQSENTFVFGVPMTANKHEVAAAISAQFEVTVEDIRISLNKGKAKRSVRKGGKAVTGRRIDTKKAYVRLKAGDHIPVFAAIEKAEEDEKKAEEKAAKKAGKSESKIEDSVAKADKKTVAKKEAPKAPKVSKVPEVTEVTQSSIKEKARRLFGRGKK